LPRRIWLLYHPGLLLKTVQDLFLWAFGDT
jgi:hypothetical protein